MRLRKLLPRRDEGNVLMISVLIVTLLVAFCLAQFTVVEKNIASARFFNTRSELRKYAESGAFIAIHDLRYNATGSSGNIGTTLWTAVDDLGGDGQANTRDEGEGDGIPTFGEPNVFPVTTGPRTLRADMVTHIFDAAGGSKRVVASVRNPEATVTVERVYIPHVVTVPIVSALLVSPEVDLDLRGNAFTIDGRDHTADGTLVAGNDHFGLATVEGDTAGENRLALVSQIPSGTYDQVMGDGGEPSVGEVPADTVDMEGLFEQFKGAQTATISSGTYNDFDLEALAGDEFPITYADGDLHLTGSGKGQGVLIVDGSLTISGQFEFDGLIVVNGDLRMTGGGTTVHATGSVLVKDSISAVEDSSDVSVNGNADLLFSSEILQRVQDKLALSPDYDPVHYKE